MPSLESQSKGAHDCLAELSALGWQAMNAHHDRVLRDSRIVAWPTPESYCDAAALIALQLEWGKAEKDAYQQAILEEIGFVVWPSPDLPAEHEMKGALSN